MNDEDIIALLFARDESAIAELSGKYGSLCLKIAGNILFSREDAEECVSGAYYGVWETIPPQKPGNLRAYICRIVKNLAMSRVRYNTADKRSSNLTVSLAELSECIPGKGGVEESVSSSMLGEAISRFLRSQPKKYRTVFVRRYWYSESVADIAEFYGLNENTVSSYLFRTRKRLKEFLEKEGYSV